MEKHVIIINGRGGVGKDALIVELAKNIGYEKVGNISSIDPVKEAAKKLGWDEKKDEKGRKFLSELKRAMAGYNDAPAEYCRRRIKMFLKDELWQILFVHIREATEIEKVAKFAKEHNVSVKTVLIRREGVGATGNSSDDDVENTKYDITFDNNAPLEESGKAFTKAIMG